MLTQDRERVKPFPNPEKKVEKSKNLIILHNAQSFCIYYGGVAQLGEHLPCKQGVMGSNPIISTK